jgi:hypothetical protein
VHFHVLLRLDGVDPVDRDALVPPPAGITVDDLDAAVLAAARQITVITPARPDRPEGWMVAWGEQVDVRRIGTIDGDLTDSSVAGYLAKYVTKSTEGYQPLLNPAHPGNHRRLRRPGRRPPRPPHRRLLAPRPPHPHHHRQGRRNQR